MGDFNGLNFPDYTPVDHARHCQQYTTIINRNDDDMVQLDEMDSLQMDLETLLVATTRRMHHLISGLQSLSDGQEGKKDKKFEFKRTKPMEERPNKKLKSADSPAHAKYFPTGSTNVSSGRSKAKGSTPKVLEYESVAEDSAASQPTRVPVNDAPNKFWQSIEPYCAPITQEHVDMLEKLCQSHAVDNKEYYEIPDLGEHFSQRWALEDMREEKSEGNRAIVKTSEKQDNKIDGVLKKASDTMTAGDPCPFGSLTQRLISAFVDENIMLPPEHAASLIESGKDGVNPLSMGSGNLSANPIKFSKSLTHTHKLESRIKMELIEQGILEPDTADSKKEDEVLAELIRSQQELRAVGNRNRDVLQQLLQVAKEEMKRQEIKRNVDTINTEVMDHYRRVMAARQKKRTLQKKEKDAALKALRERDALIKQLE